ncbi:nuclear transport factor 2 family protein [Ramlibacter sp.]|uniref:nuclear transport factor 2 family protein n=1 Tax=Ramlibacter sp. TaxID=1917967 RepID=UPI0017D90704|nr:nuclear transport factor 2 family protein [Ramlibacter sp.]MBA2673764.1 nuclear transport factor 2 family protein [Ramlibacter sp.]
MPTSSPMTADALFQRYAQTFRSRDVEAIGRLHTDQSRFQLHSGEAAVVGRAAIQERFARFFAQWPEMDFVVKRVLTGASHWVLDWALTARLPLPGGGARQIQFDCMDLVTVDAQGLVAAKDTFVDLVQVQAALKAAAAT